MNAEMLPGCFKWFNRLVSFVYLLISIKVLMASKSHSTHIGDLTLLMVLAILMIGHFMLKGWAVKISAALSGFVLMLAVFYLITPFDRDLLLPFNSRIVTCATCLIVTVLMIFNYYIYGKINSQKQMILAKK